MCNGDQLFTVTKDGALHIYIPKKTLTVEYIILTRFSTRSIILFVREEEVLEGHVSVFSRVFLGGGGGGCVVQSLQGKVPFSL